MPDIKIAPSRILRTRHSFQIGHIGTYLDRFTYLLEKEDRQSVLNGMGQLCEMLYEARQHILDQDQWKALCQYLYRHRIARYIFSDPYTLRSFQKPWKYPGDALLLDYIYKLNPVSDITSVPIVRYIHEFCINSQASRAVRYRASVISNYIDSVNLRSHNTQILSVACGHMRELTSLKSVGIKPIHQFIAVDHEDRCYQTVVKDNPGLQNFKFYHTNVLDMIRSKEAFPKIGYDFIYSAGLFDYLSDKISFKLIQTLVDSLRKDGVLLVTNFKPNIPDIGYMESYMDWYLIFRTCEELLRLVEPLKANVTVRAFNDPYSNIAYLEIIKLS